MPVRPDAEWWHEGMLNDLQEGRTAWSRDSPTLPEILDQITTLGIRPDEVTVISGGARMVVKAVWYSQA